MKYISIPSTLALSVTFEHGQPVLFFSEASECQQPGGALSGREDGPMVPGIDMEFPKKMKAIQQLLGIPPCIETSIYIHIYTYVYIYYIYMMLHDKNL